MMYSNLDITLSLIWPRHCINFPKILMYHAIDFTWINLFIYIYLWDLIKLDETIRSNDRAFLIVMWMLKLDLFDKNNIQIY